MPFEGLKKLGFEAHLDQASGLESSGAVMSRARTIYSLPVLCIFCECAVKFTQVLTGQKMLQTRHNGQM